MVQSAVENSRRTGSNADHYVTLGRNWLLYITDTEHRDGIIRALKRTVNMEYLISDATDSLYNGGGDPTPVCQVTADGPGGKITKVTTVDGGFDAIASLIKDRMDEGITLEDAVGLLGASGCYKEAAA